MVILTLLACTQGSVNLADSRNTPELLPTPATPLPPPEPPTPEQLDLRVSDLVVGRPVHMELTGNVPFSDVRFVVGPQPLVDPNQLDGHTLVGETTTDADGLARFDMASGPLLPPGPLVLQAVVDGSIADVEAVVWPVGGLCSTHLDFVDTIDTTPKVPDWAYSIPTFGQWDVQARPFRCAADTEDAEDHAATGHYASFGYLPTSLSSSTREYFEFDMNSADGETLVTYRNTRCDYWDGEVLAPGGADELMTLATYLWWVDYHSQSRTHVLDGQAVSGDLDYAEVCTVLGVGMDESVAYTLTREIWSMDPVTHEVVSLGTSEITESWWSGSE